MTMDPEYDQARPSSTYHDDGRSELFDWMIHLGLIDFWRLENPSTQEFTGPQSKNRIDYCLASVDFYDKFIRSSGHAFSLRLGNSDHIPVEFSASSDSPLPRDKLPFKCPPWLLRCENVQAQLQLNLEHLLSCLDPTRNPGCILDEHKRRDRIFLSREYLRRKGATAAQLRRLLVEFRESEASFAITSSDANARRLEETRQAFSDFSTALRERNAISKFDSDVALAEKSSKTFFRAPATAELKLGISSVDTPTGISHDPEVIKATHREYWGKLFQSDSRDLAAPKRPFDRAKLHSILQHSLQRLTTANKALLDAPLTANDFYYAIKTTARGKAPGPDGLPAEYYQLFPSQWALILELVYASQFRMGRMTKFQRRAYLSLLFKKGSRSDPKNYRPLTLLNQDAKFGPKALAFRLNQILPTLLGMDQYGFVPGRDIRHALRYFLDLMDRCKLKDSRDPAGAICLDFAKAFDSVNWQALDLVLQHWGFGPNFRRWVQTFFQGTLVQVLVNTSRSDFFSLGAGVRQGDPLSPGLFVLFIEPLLCYLRALNTDFEIKIRSTPHHILSFADDVTGLVNDLHKAPIFLARVQDFCAATGMRLNVDKTVIFPFRPWTNADEDLRHLLSTCGAKILDNDGHTQLLGLTVGPCCTPQFQLSKLLVRFQKLCVIWRWRARTLRGRVLLMKTMILSILWHFLGTQAIPRVELLRFDALMRNFVNNTPSTSVEDPAARSQFPSKWHAIASQAGGLDLPSVATSVELLQVNLIRQLIRQCRRDLSAVPKWFIPAQAAFDEAFAGQGTGLDFLYIPLSHWAHTSRWKKVPQYWRAALATWSTKILPKLVNANPVFTKLTWPIWNNTFLRFTNDRRTLAALHRKASQFLSHQGILRISTFCCCFGWIPDESTLRVALAGSSIKSDRSKTVVVKALAPRVAIPAHYGSFAIYPLPPETMIAALHVWTFDGHDIVHATNSTIRRLLAATAPPPLPLERLGAPNTVLPASFWATERVLQRDILPTFSDLLFRLQHNGLGFRYKYGWHTADTQCVHRCPDTETAKHLFWDCILASRLWHFFLPPFRRILQLEFTWDQVLFLQGVEVPPVAKDTYGTSLPIRLFNIVRCCVFRALWMNRNKAIYDGPALSFVGVYRQSLATVRLHFQRLFKSLTNPRKLECTTYKSHLLAFKCEWLRDFDSDPFTFFEE
ncbi:Reverse transcriptase (RNA-dependent DNA polymerase) [Phytophthora infestans]|uniref:Reverse transcriptase (RNA-dependent DNA polymerase) n=2 Tax=Phytophthora infestans TaxID=4787 RepID=A0A833SNZ1_PHYIN|nr:Reverse transcriptase (RNA-dependent DNA polymerase) [Phytophthora infestans]KAF4127197.1 Reverse transcriptase (RNA-dependent DNA polymerase) [Phytophthora infestans]KAF4134284.1 Reverse transcriptase (RNA-dependent DNA polymerase) [Phytophthora infestans]